MAIATYDQLRTAVEGWMHRADLTAMIPDFISIGEAHLNRCIRVPEMIHGATVNTSVSDRYAAIPAGAIDVLSLIDEYGTVLRQASASAVAELAQSSSAGTPQWYAVTSQLEFDCVSDTAHPMIITYRKQFDIATDGQNWLLSTHPDCYLYAALFAAEPYINNDVRVGTWKALRDEAVADANAAGTHKMARTLRCDHGLVGGETFNIYRG